MSGSRLRRPTIREGPLRRAFSFPASSTRFLQLALLDPKLRGDVGIVAAHLVDKTLGVLATDEHLKLDAEREVAREGVIDDGLDDHGS